MDQKYYLFDRVFQQSGFAQGWEVSFGGAIPREDGYFDLQFTMFSQAGYSGGGSTLPYRAKPGETLRLGRGVSIYYSKKDDGKLGASASADHCVIRSIEKDCLELTLDT